MSYSPELQRAADKYYQYAAKYLKCKGKSRILLAQKLLQYKEETETLFRIEYQEWLKDSRFNSTSNYPSF